MDAPKISVTPTPSNSKKPVESSPSVVFQPQKLKEIVEVVDLMGSVASRIREDASSDLPFSGSTKASQKSSGATARDEAIAKAPPVAIMQQKLVAHLKEERAEIQRQAKTMAHSNAPGAAWTITELYKKMRRLSSLISQILEASAEMIKRFYISAFIDQQPLVVTGGSIAQSEK